MEKQNPKKGLCSDCKLIENFCKNCVSKKEVERLYDAIDRIFYISEVEHDKEFIREIILLHVNLFKN